MLGLHQRLIRGMTIVLTVSEWYLSSSPCQSVLQLSMIGNFNFGANPLSGQLLSWCDRYLAANTLYLL